MLSRLPKKGELAIYRRSLRRAMVRGLDKDVVGAVIQANPRARRVRALPPESTVLYIVPRRISKKTTQASILAKHSPWTLDTLPFYPSRKDAKIISRRATEREVQQTQRARDKDRKQWRRALLQLGVRVAAKKQVKAARLGKAVTDVAFEGARLELGLGGTKAIPHWRPAVRALLKSGMKSLARDPYLRRWLRSVQEPGVPPTRIRSQVTVKDALTFRGFQRKLAIR